VLSVRRGSCLRLATRSLPLLMALALAPSVASAQPRTLTAEKASKPPTIDGAIETDEWTDAATARDFM
jgi:hypothetical protein